MTQEFCETPFCFERTAGQELCRRHAVEQIVPTRKRARRKKAGGRK